MANKIDESLEKKIDELVKKKKWAEDITEEKKRQVVRAKILRFTRDTIIKK